ncbi:putative MATE family efflux protein [Desulfobotulus alkaliphilus]|uniref:Multidrug export protein MepA n=1 Tax=Desulfobotulus alkaliphilus TaxID=622671 RepID=A0A562S5Y5_9BACT|nr:MATE family efflux transporter [Desulfobotulus alkaliphilus]TWI76759.1 putative MATE family efflux protein [Desulfobotulus alkaliphilus]
MKSGSVSRMFWRYTIPSVTAMLVSAAYQIVDGIFIGHAMGGEGLAAINMSWPWIGVLLAIGMMIGIGTGVQCGIAQGEGDLLRASRIMGQGFWALMLLGLVSGLLLVNFSTFFLVLQGAEEGVGSLGRDYLRVMGFAAPLVLASIAIPFWVRNLGAPGFATLCMATGAVANIILDYLFIMHLGWELKGAAVATVLAESFSIAMGLFFIFSTRNRVPLNQGFLKLRPFLLGRVLATGFSSMLMYIYISFVVLLHNLLFMAYGGTLQVAAFTVVGYVLTLYYMFAEGVSGGMQPLVSYYKGEENPRNIRQVTGLAMAVVLGTGVLMTSTVMLVPGLAVWFFVSGDPELSAAASLGMRLHLFALFLDGFIVLTASFLQSMGMARKATMITLGNMFIQLPFLFILPKIIGLQGVWIALPLSNVVLASIVSVFFFREMKKLKRKGEREG